MIKRELAKDETLKGENWDRFLPQFKVHAATCCAVVCCLLWVLLLTNAHSWDYIPLQQRAAKKKKKKEGTTKKPSFNPFPPEQMPRKIDQQLESGEYFLSQDTKRRMKEEEREGECQCESVGA